MFVVEKSGTRISFLKNETHIFEQKMYILSRSKWNDSFKINRAHAEENTPVHQVEGQEDYGEN